MSQLGVSQLPERQIQFGVFSLINSGNYGLYYNDPVTFKSSILWGRKLENDSKKWIGITIGFYKMTPIRDTFYYEEDSYLSFSDRTVFQLGSKLRLEFPFGNKVGVHTGIDIGYIFEKYSFINRYPGVINYFDVSASGLFLCPFVGLTINLSNTLGIYLLPQYEMSVHGTDDVGDLVRRALSVGGGIQYNF